MEGLISFLIIAGLFYFMMRHGCGSHMTHGHGGHGHSDSNNADDDRQAAKHIDPVCETEVKTEQGYGKMHKGVLYRFCSKRCLDKFDADPERYLDKEQGVSHDM